MRRVAIALAAVLGIVALLATRGTSASTSDRLSIDALTLLLPPSIQHDHHIFTVHHPVHAFGACFDWRSSDSATVAITPIPSTQCSVNGRAGYTGVLLSTPLTAHTLAARASARIFAESLADTNDRERVDVFIDRIANIAPKTVTRKIYVNHIETMELLAYDSDDNVFSSIDGLPFHWAITPVSVLRRVTHHDAKLNVSRVAMELESMNRMSHIVVGVGRESGIANVSVALATDTDGNRVRTQFAVLVTEDLELTPDMAIIAPRSSLTIHAFTTRSVDDRGNPLERIQRDRIPLPNDRYQYQQSNGTVLSLDSDSGMVVAKTLGHSVVRLFNRRTSEIQQPHSHIVVTQPQSLRTKLKSVDDGRMIESCHVADYYTLTPSSTNYQLIVSLYDSQRELMTLTPNNQFTVTVDSDSVIVPVTTISVDDVSTQLTVPINVAKRGKSTVRIQFTAIIDAVSGQALPVTPAIETVVTIVGTAPITVKSASLHLPYIPSQSIETTITATGGSGSGYHFESLTPTIATIVTHRNDSVVVRAVGEGDAVVKVTDSCNADNHAVSHSHFLAPVLLSRSTINEAERFTNLVVGPIEIVDPSTNKPFNACPATLSLHANIEGKSKHFKVLGKSDIKCRTDCRCGPVMLMAESHGVNDLKLALSPQHSLTISIHSFRPLQTQRPEFLAAIGSPVLVRVDGGPISAKDGDSRILALNAYQSITHPVAIAPHTVYQLNDSNATIRGNVSRIDLVPVIGKKLHYEVTCYYRGHGDALSLVIEAHNPVSSLHPQPIVARLIVQILCFPPVALPSPVTVGLNGQKKIVAVTRDNPAETHTLSNAFFWTSDNDSVASVDQTGVVTGKAIGTTIIRVEKPRDYVANPHTDGLTSSTVVEVQFGQFSIVMSNSHLTERQLALAHIESDSGAKPGDASFSTVQCEWFSESDGIVVRPPLTNTLTVNRKVVGVSVEIMAIKPGYYTLSAVVSAGSRNQSLTYTVHVIETLSLLSQPTLLLPFNSHTAIVTSHDDNNDSRLRYAIHTDSNGDSDSTVTIDHHGRLTVRPRQNNENGGDAIVLVQSSPVTDNAVTSINSLSLSQSLSVLVAVRPIAALELRSNQSLNRPLCSEQSIVVAVTMQDSLGRVFDNHIDSTDQWHGERSARTNTGSLLDYSVSDDSVVSASLVDSASAEWLFHHGVVAHLRLTAKHPTATNTNSAIVTLRLKGHERVQPIHFQLYTQSTDSTGECATEPHGLLLSCTVKPQSLPASQDARNKFVSHLTATLSQVTGVSESQLSVLSVDRSTGKCDVLVLPFDMNDRHASQWFLSSPSLLQSLSVDELAERWNLTLSKRSELASMIDTHTPPVIQPTPVPVTLLEQPRTETLWTDNEIYVSTTGRTALPPRVNGATTSPYDLIVQRMLASQQDSWPQYFAAHSVSVPLMATLSTIVLSLLWLYHRLVVLPRDGVIPRSFGLWLSETAQSLARALLSPRRARAEVTPVKGVGIRLSGRAHQVQ